MPSEEPALGVELKRVAVHRQHCTLGPVLAGELNQLACAGAISDCLRVSVASSSPCSCLAFASPPPFARHRHHCDRRRRPTRTGTATATATATTIGIMAVVIPIRTAATTDAVLPAANSADAVRERCHRCRVGGPVGGVVVDDDAVAVDAPEASPLPPSGAMDPTAAATTKTLDGDGDSSNGNGNDDGGDGDNGNGTGDGDGGGGVRRMRRRRPLTQPGRLPPPPGGRPLDRHDDGEVRQPGQR